MRAAATIASALLAGVGLACVAAFAVLGVVVVTAAAPVCAVVEATRMLIH